MAYEELRRLASSVKRSHPNATANPSSLVNAAWLRLASSLKISPQSELHFRRIAAQAMRQILVEAARRRTAHKRGGNEPILSFDDALGVAVSCDREVLAVHAALEELAKCNPRQAEIIECRFFGGMEVLEVAETLGISAKTVDRDWRAAKAWLASRIRERR
jgi:RNA polymerase sigma factor (TIGR02999 family)